MKRNRLLIFMIIGILALVNTVAQADVMQASTTQMDFKGALGTMMRLVGAGKPIQTVDFYRGNVHKTDTIDKDQIVSSQIIDLDQELFISIDHKRKKYTQMTFEEWRKMMEENMKKMDQEPADGKRQKDEAAPEVEWSFNVDVKKTGETETIAGEKTEKAIIKLTVAAKASRQETGESSQGEMVVTSSSWLSKNARGQDEIQAFYKKLAEKLGFMPGEGAMKDMVAKLSQGNPQLAEAMKKMQEESKKLSGVAMRVATVYETQNVASTGQKPAEANKPTEIPTSVGGLIKGFGKKMAKSEPETGAANILLETKTEITKYEVAPIDAQIFTIPPDYKLQK